MTRRLLIKAKGGFGNRILSAVSGLVYADLAGRTPVIDWRDGQYAPRGEDPFHRLFESPLETVADALATLDDPGDIAPAIWRGRLDRHPTDMISEFDPARHSDPRIWRKYCVDITRTDQTADLAVYWSYLPKFRHLARLMRADARFRDRPLREIVSERLDRIFRPNARVRSEVAEGLARIPRPIIGVHVRYTDMKVPLERIEREIARLRAARPEASIFLATDNQSVQSRLMRGFERVHVIEKWLPEDSGRLHGHAAAADPLREAENALIDMWMLAGCDQLVYSRHSTFSHASSLIGGFAPADLVDVDRRNPVVIAKRLVHDFA